MGEDSIILPIDIEVDVKSDDGLEKLRAEIQKIKDTTEKSMNRRGKGAFSEFDKAKLKESIDSLNNAEILIGKITSKIAALSKQNLGTEFQKASNEAKTYAETVKQLERELKSAQNAKGGAGKKLSAANDFEKKTISQIEAIKQSAVDAGRAITDAEKEVIYQLQQEAELRKSLAENDYSEAANHYSSTKSQLEYYREVLRLSEERKSKVSDIIDSEQESLEYNKQIDDEIASTNGQLSRTVEIYKSIGRAAKDILDTNGVNTKGIDDSTLSPEEKEKAFTLEQLSKAEYDVAHKTKSHADAENEEAKATKSSNAQFYYKLRAIKMLGFVANQAQATLENFGKKSIKYIGKAVSMYAKLLTPISLVRRAMSKLNSESKKLGTGIRSTTKAHDGFHMSLKQALTTILKYGFGIRSLYVLLNKMRQAVSQGLEQMAVQFADVNARMSSIVTSMNQIKAAITSVIEPILTVLAPLLEKIAALVSDIAYKVASFIAALTGQSVVLKATRVQTDYAASLDKTAKSAKEAKKQLSGLDKLNVINSEKDNDSGSGNAPTMGWEKVPIDSTMADWAKKFKDFLDKLFAPIKAAWDRTKKYLEASWKYMWGQLGALAKAVAEDFWKVWSEKKTEDMFAYMFLSLGDIMNIIGTIAKKLKEAWKYADNGYRILASIRDIVYEIVKHFHDITSYTRDWAERELNFKPAMTAIADVLQKQVVPAVRRILDLVVLIWNKGILDLVRDFINTNLPVLIRGVGYFIEGFGLIAKRIQMALETGTKAGKNIEYVRSRLQQIIDKVEHFSHLISETFRTMGKDFRDWAEQLDFSPLFDAVINFLNSITPMFEFLFGKFEVLDGKFQHTGGIINKLWKDTILPFWKYIIEDGGPKLLDIFGKIFGQYDEETGFGIDWDKLTERVGKFIDTIEPFLELAWKTFLQIIEDIGKAFDDWVNSDALGTIVDGFAEWVKNADPGELATKIESFAKAFAELYVGFTVVAKVILPVATGILTLVNAFNAVGGPIKSLIGSAAAKAGGTGLSGLLSILGQFAIPIAAVVGAIALMVGAFGGVGETIKELKERFDDVKKSVSEFAEKIGFNDTINNLKSAFDNLKGSLEGLRPIFEFLLDVVADNLAQAFTTVLGALDGLALSFTGVIDVISGISDIIGGIIKAIEGLITQDFVKVNEGLSEIEKGIGEIFLGLGEAVAGVINGIAEALAGFTDKTLPSVSEGVGTFVTNVKNLFQWLREQLIGDPIIYDIRDGIIEGFGEWISQTATDVGGWVTDRVTDFSNLAKDVGTTIGTMSTDVVNKFGELKKGAGEKAKELVATAKEKFGEVKTKAKDNFESSKFVTFGKNAVSGIERGIKAFGTVLSAASANAQNLRARFNSGLNASTLVSTGVNLINGLRNGLMSALNSALQAVSTICSRITDTAKKAFEIHSPSKVFKDIGAQLMAGMTVGVEDNADEVTDSFGNLLPSKTMLNEFYDTFVDVFTNITSEITNMFDTMFAHIEETMGSLERFISMSNVMSSLDKIPKLAVPEIVVGQTLPSNKSFKNSNSDSNLERRLPEIIRKAVIDAISDTADLRDDDETVIVNIDGKEIFKAVRNRNAEYKKQHGVSALA